MVGVFEKVRILLKFHSVDSSLLTDLMRPVTCRQVPFGINGSWFAHPLRRGASIARHVGHRCSAPALHNQARALLIWNAARFWRVGMALCQVLF